MGGMIGSSIFTILVVRGLKHCSKKDEQPEVDAQIKPLATAATPQYPLAGPNSLSKLNDFDQDQKMEQETAQRTVDLSLGYGMLQHQQDMSEEQLLNNVMKQRKSLKILKSR